MQTCFSNFAKKGMTPEKAAVLVEDPLFLACLMIKAGDADGEIAGAENTTGNIASCFANYQDGSGHEVCFRCVPYVHETPQYGDDGILVFADCAVMPNPSMKSWLASLSLPPLRLVIS